MSIRFKMGKVYPAAYKAMDGLDKLNGGSLVDNWHRELIKIRASQINGCAYCVNQHAGEAIKQGIDFKKINLVSVWREATNVFNDEERLIIQMTEEITLISQHGLSDEIYNAAIQMFGEEKTAHILLLIITINAWNRTGVGLKMEPVLI